MAAFLLLRPQIGPLWANVAAFTGAAVFNNWANRRWTFRRRGVAGRWWHAAGAVVFWAVTLAASCIGLAIVEPNRLAEVTVLVVTWGLAGLFRFTLLRSWVYRRRLRHG